MTPLQPALALLVGALLASLCSRLPARTGRLVLALLVVLASAEPLARSVRFDRVIAQTDTRLLAQQWLAEQAEPDDAVAILGTRFWSWGAPELPEGLRAVRVANDRFRLADVDWVVTHDHELFWSTLDPAALARILARLEARASFDPRTGADEDCAPVFEVPDAFYVPYTGLCGVTRPGPKIQIYRVR